MEKTYSKYAKKFDEKTPIGDNYIDFGLGDISVSNSIVLDFNVDGRVDQYL